MSVSGMQGLNVDAVEAWLSVHVPSMAQPLEWTRLEGGHSNLTYAVRGQNGMRAVVRRPPLGNLQPRAHDMVREFKVVSALWPTAVPVPEPLALCEDTDVTGAPFYVMRFVEGRSLGSAADVASWLPDPALHQKAAESYFDTIANLHLLDPAEIGLGDLTGRRDFVGRQLSSWHRGWIASARDADFDDPRVHEMHDLLSARKPEPWTDRLVHCDMGMHNCLLSPEADVVAVLDWEVCTLGDPRFDVAYALARWSVEGAQIPGRETATLPASFPTADAMRARYEERTGAEIKDLDYFIALNHWRWACIAQTVYARYVRGQKSAEGIDLPAMRQLISTRLDHAEQSCAALTAVAG